MPVPWLETPHEVKMITSRKVMLDCLAPFTRISTMRVGGHGLGLSIVSRIVHKLGGKVGGQSTPGAGSRFWFELPTGATPASLRQ